MLRKAWLLAMALTVAGSARAAGVHFAWQTGQVLNYRVEQTTVAAEVLDGKKLETSTKLNNVKRWQVLDVDSTGVATLQLSLTALRVETKTPTGEAIVFDSAKPEANSADMRDQLGKYVGAPLAVVRVDPQGRVVEVKECKYGPASKFESEPPFVITLPENALEIGQSWERPYRITLEPPQGAGEKYDSVQKYACQGLENGIATIVMQTAVKNPPASLADQIPLLQMQPEGSVVFNAQAGRLDRAALHVEKELKNHQGEGSSYKFQSNYTEVYAGDR